MLMHLHNIQFLWATNFSISLFKHNAISTSIFTIPHFQILLLWFLTPKIFSCQISLKIYSFHQAFAFTLLPNMFNCSPKNLNAYYSLIKFTFSINSVLNHKLSLNCFSGSHVYRLDEIITFSNRKSALFIWTAFDSMGREYLSKNLHDIVFL